MKAWAIKNPKGNVQALTTSEDRDFAWRRQFSMFDGKADWQLLRTKILNATAKGYRAVQVEITEVKREE